MKDLIAEARELCEKATPGPWEWTASNDFGSELEAENLKGVIGLEDDYPGYPECGEHLIMNLSKADAAFIARSRTLIPELCDTLVRVLNDAEGMRSNWYKSAENYQQKCRDITELEAELEKSSGCVWCKDDSKVFHDGQHFHMFCSYCGKKLEVNHAPN